MPAARISPISASRSAGVIRLGSRAFSNGAISAGRDSAEDKRLWIKNNDFSYLAQLRVFARNGANQREVGFQDDVGDRAQLSSRRFAADMLSAKR
jgi:hypothetical protein